MEEHRKKAHPMDIEQPWDSPSHSTPLGSPSYSPPERDELTEEKEDKEFDQDDSDEEGRATRRNAKGKYKASLLPIEEEDDRPNQLPPTATQPEDTTTHADAHRASPTHEARFADADAAMNDALSASSLDCDDEENEPNTTPASHDPQSERRNVPTLNAAKLMDKLVSLQQLEQWRGRDGGRGAGWGLEWQETMTREKVEGKGWGGYEGSSPSPVGELEQEDVAWEVYNEEAWERAAEWARGQEAGKVTLKVPAVGIEDTGGKGGTARAVGGGDTAGGYRELVRAVTGYRAILRGAFLNYDKGDVMEVVFRDWDGKLMLVTGSHRWTC